jgi:hypothetical protein
MKVATAAAQAPAFTLDPTLPWLRTDPTMQQHEAFVGMRTVKLSAKGWAPMGLYFPGGTTLAMVQVTKMEDLIPGLYWHEHTPSNPEMLSSVCTDGVIYNFGRFEGFGELSRAEARRYKRGRAHIELSCDTLECDLQAYYLRQDGTDTVFVNFGADTGSGPRKIWRITHYVTTPFDALYLLGEDAYNASGLTADQTRWLKEEAQLQKLENCSEYSAYTLGDFPQASCRAILQGEEAKSFSILFGYLPALTPSQAKKHKAGAVAITWRSYNHAGQPIGYTKHYKLEVARVLLDMLQSHVEVDKAVKRLASAANTLAAAATDLRETLESKLNAAEVAEPSRELATAA